MNRSPHILLVEAPYYAHIADQLRRGAERALVAAGATHESISVPGAFEIPAAIGMVARATKRFDGFVALGCVVRGETSHYDIVAGESARGLMDLALTHRLPVGNGILTVDTEAQAIARANPDKWDKGGGAANAALALIRLKRGLAAP